jgi:molybdopterin/thiamine biosynthesis adenylyltransferase
MNKKRYIRQTTLNEVGTKGQQKLFDAKVLIVGCGGLGNFVAVNLAASGIGNLHLVDFDTIDISNLHRQVFYKTEDVGKAKAEILSQYIKSINAEIIVSFSNQRIVKNAVRNLIKQFDIVVDCTDSLETKYLLNDACVLEQKTFVYGSLHKFEAHVSTFNLQADATKRTANLRDVFPEMPTEEMPNCSEVGTLNPIVGMAGMLQTNEVLKVVLSIGKPLVNQLLIYNALANSQMKMNLQINNDLNFEEIWKTNNYNEEKTCEMTNPNEIVATELNERVANKTIKVISVLEEESEIFEADFHFPFSCFVAEDIKLEKAEYAIVCNVGSISKACGAMLRKQYPDYSFRSLKGGVFSLV